MSTLVKAMVTVFEERSGQTFGGWMARSVIAEHIAFDWLSFRKDGSTWPSYHLALQCERYPALFECSDNECEWIRLRPPLEQAKMERLCGLVKLRPDDWVVGYKGSGPVAAAYWHTTHWNVSVVIYSREQSVVVMRRDGQPDGEWPGPGHDLERLSRGNITLEEMSVIVRTVLAADGRLVR